MTSERAWMPECQTGQPRFWFVASLVLALGLAGGCENDHPPGTAKQVIEVAALPTKVREAADNALPGVRFSDAWKNVDRASKSLHSYEVRGHDARGKVREVRVSPTGVILEME